MRGLTIVVIAALMSVSSPVWATKTYPNDMNDFAAKYPISRTNINPRSARTGASQDAFPQGKNAFKPMQTRTIAGANKPKKTVCVGNDCGCTSGKNR